MGVWDAPSLDKGAVKSCQEVTLGGCEKSPGELAKHVALLRQSVFEVAVDFNLHTKLSSLASSDRSSQRSFTGSQWPNAK